MTALMMLVTDARRTGLTLDRSAGGTLTVRGPRSAEALVRQLLDRKAEVLPFVEVYNGRSTLLDWRHATVTNRASRCLLCQRWALICDPYDGQAVHKTCVEKNICPFPGTEAKGQS